MISLVLLCTCTVGGAMLGDKYEKPVASLHEMSRERALQVLNSDLLFYGDEVWASLHNTLLNNDILRDEFLTFAIQLYAEPMSETAVGQHPTEDVDWEYWYRRAGQIEQAERLRREAELAARAPQSGGGDVSGASAGGGPSSPSAAASGGGSASSASGGDASGACGSGGPSSPLAAASGGGDASGACAGGRPSPSSAAAATGVEAAADLLDLSVNETRCVRSPAHPEALGGIVNQRWGEEKEEGGGGGRRRRRVGRRRRTTTTTTTDDSTIRRRAGSGGVGGGSDPTEEKDGAPRSAAGGWGRGLLAPRGPAPGRLTGRLAWTTAGVGEAEHAPHL